LLGQALVCALRAFTAGVPAAARWHPPGFMGILDLPEVQLPVELPEWTDTQLLAYERHDQ